MSGDQQTEAEDEKEPGGEKEGLSRRALLKLLLGMSVLLSAIPFVPMIDFLFAKKREQSESRKMIGNLAELPEGSTQVFFFPGEEDFDRSFLVHLPKDLLELAKEQGRDQYITNGFVAFNTICPHLQCPCELPEEDQIVCPCHGGYFRLTDGTVVEGPPPRPLPVIKLEVEEETGDIYAVGLIGKIGYGRE